MRIVLPLCAALVLGGCATNVANTARSAAEPTTPTSSPAPTTAFGDEVIARTNAERLKRGLPELARNASLVRAAQIQATQMASMRKMAHDLPGAEYPSMSSRLAAVGYKMAASGENVAEGHPTPTAVVAGWLTSQAHRDNMLSTRFTEMGAAVATATNGRTYWVQVFGRPR
jgi:uncharacterized protein YkwD